MTAATLCHALIVVALLSALAQTIWVARMP
jgi:hypothetical protein